MISGSYEVTATYSRTSNLKPKDARKMWQMEWIILLINVCDFKKRASPANICRLTNNLPSMTRGLARYLLTIRVSSRGTCSGWNGQSILHNFDLKNCSINYWQNAGGKFQKRHYYNISNNSSNNITKFFWCRLSTKMYSTTN